MAQGRGSVLTGLGLGAGLMYFFDPERGRRRRALVRDRLVHATTLAGDAAGATGRDLAHRATGTAARLRGAFRDGSADDHVLLERVRAKLGRLVSHPHALHVEAADGVVTLRGPILRDEAARLVKQVRGMKGVRDVVSQLEEHDSAGNVPALQGGSTRPGTKPELWQREWSPTARLLTGTSAIALASYGAARRDTPGTLMALAALGLLARAGTNLEMTRLTGIGSDRRAVDVQKTITIDKPAETVFRFWSDYENFPRFMSRVLDVRAGARDGLSHWTVAGPGGMPVHFDAEVSALEPNRRLAWRTVEGARVAHAGVVQFEAAGPDRTRVTVRMSYNPPGGWIGHQVATAFGVDPKHSIDADLVRMKTLLETGHAPHDAARPVVH